MGDGINKAAQIIVRVSHDEVQYSRFTVSHFSQSEELALDWKLIESPLPYRHRLDLHSFKKIHLQP